MTPAALHPPGWVFPDHSLQSRHTLRCPARAQWLVEGTTRQRVCDSIRWAVDAGLAVHVLGQGSNVLIADFVSDLTLVNQISGVRFIGSARESVTVDVGSGVNWHWWVRFCAAQGWHGLENLALIPGTVGAAPVQNIGAYGVEVGDWIDGLEAVDLTTGETRWFDQSECGFGYRQSLFKSSEPGRWCILRVRFVLARRFAPVLDYGPLQSSSPADAAGLIALVCRIRQAKLPDPFTVPNAGSFFTNPMVDRPTLDRLQKNYPDIPSYVMPDGRVKVAAGWLIERAGLRGYVDPGTGVGTWPQQALVLINPKQRPAADLDRVSRFIAGRVAEQFDVTLEREPQWFGGVPYHRGGDEQEA